MPSPLLRHFVLFAFHPHVTADQKLTLARDFAALKTQIPTIVAFEAGRNNSPEGLSHGFEDGWLISFASEADRDAYLPHPAHQAFVASIGPLVKEALVFDYWAE